MAYKFWLVWGAGVPTHRHDDPEPAHREAQRLARLHKGSEFIVVESVAGYKDAPPEPPPLTETKYDEYDPDLPF